MASPTAGNFPKYLFPVPLCPHRGHREYFVDYGTYQNIYCGTHSLSNGPVEITAQKNHWEGSQLTAATFAVPLFKPNTVSEGTREPVMGEVTEKRNTFKKMVKNFHQIRTRCKAVSVRKAVYSRLKSILKGDEVDPMSVRRGKGSEKKAQKKPKEKEVVSEHEVDGKGKKAALPEDTLKDNFEEEMRGGAAYVNLSAIASNLPHLVDMTMGILEEPTNLEDFNSAYSGGCVAFQPWRVQGSNELASGFLAYASGSALSSLSLCCMSVDSSGKVTVSGGGTDIDVHGLVYEVVTAEVHQKYYCVCRQDSSCYIFKVKQTDSGLSATEVTSFTPEGKDEKLTSVSLSEHIAGECLVASSTGCLYLIRPDSVKVVCDEWEPRFECYSPWLHSHFGSHPRSFIVADRTGITQFNMNGSYKELLSVGQPTFDLKERITMASAVKGRPHYVLVATTHSLILLDDRLPSQLVLHWSHCLQSAPVYLSSCQLLNEPDCSVIIIGGQTDNTSVCYKVKFPDPGEGSPVSVCTPWRTARPADFLSAVSTVSTSFNHITIRERLDVPLAAVCCFPIPHGFTVLQSTGFGDIFHQTFTSASAGDRTVSHPASVSPEVSQWCCAWMHKLERSQEKCRLKNPAAKKCFFDPKESVLTESFGKIPHAHVMCALCMPTTRAKLLKSNVKSEDNYLDTCYACNQNVLMGSTVMEASRKDEVATNLFGFEMPRILQNIKPSVSEDPTSQILLKLWKGNQDLSEELTQRDKKVLEQRRNILRSLGQLTEEDQISEEDFEIDLTDAASVASHGSRASQRTINIIISSDKPDQLVPSTSPGTNQDPDPVPRSEPLPSEQSPFKSPLKHPSMPQNTDMAGSSRKRRFSISSQRSDRSGITQFPGFISTPKRKRKASAERSEAQTLSAVRRFEFPPTKQNQEKSPKKKKPKFVMGF